MLFRLDVLDTSIYVCETRTNETGLLTPALRQAQGHFPCWLAMSKHSASNGGDTGIQTLDLCHAMAAL